MRLQPDIEGASPPNNVRIQPAIRCMVHSRILSGFTKEPRIAPRLFRYYRKQPDKRD